MDGVIIIKPDVEYLVKLKVKDIKFYAPTIDISNTSERNSREKNLVPLEKLIQKSGKKNGINCSFFDYSFPWWVGPYKDDTHYDPNYKLGRGSVPHIAYIENNIFNVAKNYASVPEGAKYVVSVNPIAIFNGEKHSMFKPKRLARRTIIGSFYDNTFFVYIYAKNTNYEIPRDKVFKLGNIKHAVFLDSGTSTCLVINNNVIVKTGYPGFPNVITW